jgi:hypothetical protein
MSPSGRKFEKPESRLPSRLNRHHFQGILRSAVAEDETVGERSLNFRLSREPSVAIVCFKVMLIFYVSDYKGVGGLPEPGVAGVGAFFRGVLHDVCAVVALACDVLAVMLEELQRRRMTIAGARVRSLNGACVMVHCSRCCRRVGRRCRRWIEGMTALLQRLNVSPK